MTTLPDAKQQLEAGYTEGGRFTYGGASGVPMAVVDCVRDPGADFIYMSFVARYDPSFDDDDFVMVVLRPGGPGASPANDRRIDIQPVLSGTAGGAGGAATLPVDPFDYQVGTGLVPEIRTNKVPHLATYYQRTPGPSPAHVWQTLPGTPAVQVAVRSVLTSTHNWTVELKIPTTAAAGVSSWVDLGNTFGLYFVIGQVFTSAFEDVVQYPWPMDPANPTANFLVDPFGSGLKADWDPPSLGTGILVGTGAANTATGVMFNGGYNAIGTLDASNNVGSELNMTLSHVNKFVANLRNTNSSLAAPKIRARFRIAEFGLSGGIWDAGWKNVPATAPMTNPSAGVDIPALTNTTIEVDWTITAADRTTFGPLNRDQCVWVELDTAAVPPAGGAAAAQIVEQSMTHNLTVTHLSAASVKAVVDPKHLDKRFVKAGKHELVIQVATSPVTVTADRHTPVERYLAEVGHPLSTAVLNDRTGVGMAAVVAPKPSLVGRLLGRSPVAVMQPVAPIVAKTQVEANKIPFIQENSIISGKAALSPVLQGKTKIQPAQVATWYTNVNGYQRLGKTLTFNGKKRNVLAYAGSYAILARHVLAAGETANKLQLAHTLAPIAGMKSVGKGLYTLDVPAAQSLHLVSNLKTQPIKSMPVVIAKPIAVIRNLFGRPG